MTKMKLVHGSAPVFLGLLNGFPAWIRATLMALLDGQCHLERRKRPNTLQWVKWVRPHSISLLLSLSLSLLSLLSSLLITARPIPLSFLILLFFLSSLPSPLSLHPSALFDLLSPSRIPTHTTTQDKMTAAVANNQGQDLHPRKMWEPTNVQNTEMEKFRVYVNQKHSLSLGKARRILCSLIDDCSRAPFLFF